MSCLVLTLVGGMWWFCTSAPAELVAGIRLAAWILKAVYRPLTTVNPRLGAGADFSRIVHRC